MTQVATHDSASALLATPFTDDHGKLFISSGTWSVMGVELDEPILTEEAHKHNFANELGYGGKVRFLQSITGLWILQELRRDLFPDKSYSELELLASNSKPYQTLIPVRHPTLARPNNMGKTIRDLCKEIGEPIPEDTGAFVRCIYESLSFEYRQCYETILRVCGEKIKEELTAVHIIGGGVKSTLLNQICADSIQLPVYAGPVEATALGNILAQILAEGTYKTVLEVRNLIAESFPVKQFLPNQNQSNKINQVFQHYQNICTRAL